MDKILIHPKQCDILNTNSIQTNHFHLQFWGAKIIVSIYLGAIPD